MDKKKKVSMTKNPLSVLGVKDLLVQFYNNFFEFENRKIQFNFLIIIR